MIYSNENSLSVLNFFEIFFRNYPNGTDKRSLLFSLPFPRVLKWYLHYKKNDIDEKNKNSLLGHVSHPGHGFNQDLSFRC